ncbi:type I-F CRISPR-associated endoribonuclease Cas6/Csy4 [Enterobacter roggenkampii]|uniref:type I-F CRISPR-associated endoribonuclease Cas6/Csy4 n=1 Tax=Enterobacter roggenkampii TaxID=1812935 RepID=UPI003EBD7F04
MRNYIEIRLLPDGEDFTASELLSEVWGKLHIALVESKAHVAVSFPQHSASQLGYVMRLHGDSDALTALNATKWIDGLLGYVNVTDERTAPESAKYAIVSRARFRNNAARLRRRAEKRGNLSAEELDRLFNVNNEQQPDVPAVELFSHTTQQYLVMFVRHRIVDKPQAGEFNTYGLSATATVPYF